MNTNLFVAYILMVTTGITFFFAEVREHFSPVGPLEKKVSYLQAQIQEERFKHLLTSYEFKDFRTYVGTLIPEAIRSTGHENKYNQEKSYPLRSLASVTQMHTNEKLSVSRAVLAFEQGKKAFRDENYELAAKSLQAIVEKHSYSAHLPEAMFLLVESHFALRNLDRCVFYANKMLDLYPELELTGYAMTRLGKVYEFQDRYQDAIEVYKTVLRSFSDRGIAQVAESSLQAVEL